MKYLLDTDHLSILQRSAGREYAVLSRRMAQHPTTDFALSVISFHEQVLGAHTFLGRARSTSDVVRGYALFMDILRGFLPAPVLPFDTAAAAAFDTLRAQGVRVPTMDLRIAAIALSRGLTVLTRNQADFRKVPGLLVEDWTM